MVLKVFFACCLLVFPSSLSYFGLFLARYIRFANGCTAFVRLQKVGRSLRFCSPLGGGDITFIISSMILCNLLLHDVASLISF